MDRIFCGHSCVAWGWHRLKKCKFFSNFFSTGYAAKYIRTRKKLQKLIFLFSKCFLFYLDCYTRIKQGKPICIWFCIFLLFSRACYIYRLYAVYNSLSILKFPCWSKKRTKWWFFRIFILFFRWTSYIFRNLQKKKFNEFFYIDRYTSPALSVKKNLKKKFLIYLAYYTPPASHECPQKMSAQSVQLYGRL